VLILAPITAPAVNSCAVLVDTDFCNQYKDNQIKIVEYVVEILALFGKRTLASSRSIKNNAFDKPLRQNTGSMPLYNSRNP